MEGQAQLARCFLFAFEWGRNGKALARLSYPEQASRNAARRVPCFVSRQQLARIYLALRRSEGSTEAGPQGHKAKIGGVLVRSYDG